MTELKDKDNIRYKFPERTCKDCIYYPCIEINIHKLGCDFAKYGCRKYQEQDNTSPSRNL